MSCMRLVGEQPILYILNEDFEKRNRRSGVSFRGTLRWLVAQIEYSHPLFRKSSFGMHRFSKTYFMLPKRRLSNVEKYLGKTLALFITFSPNRVVGSMKSAHKQMYEIRIVIRQSGFHTFVHLSKIFVWGAYI
jgi:hypothetical protein